MSMCDANVCPHVSCMHMPAYSKGVKKRQWCPRTAALLPIVPCLVCECLKSVFGKMKLFRNAEGCVYLCMCCVYVLCMCCVCFVYVCVHVRVVHVCVVYVCVHVCLYVCKCACIIVCMYVCVHTHRYTHTHTCTHAHI